MIRIGDKQLNRVYNFFFANRYRLVKEPKSPACVGTEAGLCLSLGPAFEGEDCLIEYDGCSTYHEEGRVIVEGWGQRWEAPVGWPDPLVFDPVLWAVVDPGGVCAEIAYGGHGGHQGSGGGKGRRSGRGWAGEASGGLSGSSWGGVCAPSPGSEGGVSICSIARARIPKNRVPINAKAL